MKITNLAILLIPLLLLTACGGSSHSGSEALSGTWQSELNNHLFLVRQNGNSITIENCDEDAPYTIPKEGEFIGEAGNYLFEIVNSSQLIYSSGVHASLQGMKLEKISDATSFNSGSISIRSSNISDLSISENVCAYRETDNIYNHIAAPYLDGYILIDLSVNNESMGDFKIFDGANIDIESRELAAGVINALSGDVIVTTYTAEKLEASFTFIALDGNEYSGAINVNM